MPRLPILLFHFPIEHRRTIPHPCCPHVQGCAPYNYSVKFQVFGNHCFIVYYHTTWPVASTILEFTFTFSPSSSLFRVEYLSRTVSALHINTLASGLVKG